MTPENCHKHQLRTTALNLNVLLQFYNNIHLPFSPSLLVSPSSYRLLKHWCLVALTCVCLLYTPSEPAPVHALAWACSPTSDWSKSSPVPLFLLFLQLLFPLTSVSDFSSEISIEFCWVFISYYSVEPIFVVIVTNVIYLLSLSVKYLFLVDEDCFLIYCSIFILNEKCKFPYVVSCIYNVRTRVTETGKSEVEMLNSRLTWATGNSIF